MKDVNKYNSKIKNNEKRKAFNSYRLLNKELNSNKDYRKYIILFEFKWAEENLGVRYDDTFENYYKDIIMNDEDYKLEVSFYNFICSYIRKTYKEKDKIEYLYCTKENDLKEEFLKYLGDDNMKKENKTNQEKENMNSKGDDNMEKENVKEEVKQEKKKEGIIKKFFNKIKERRDFSKKCIEMQKGASKEEDEHIRKSMEDAIDKTIEKENPKAKLLKLRLFLMRNKPVKLLMLLVSAIGALLVAITRVKKASEEEPQTAEE